MFWKKKSDPNPLGVPLGDLALMLSTGTIKASIDGNALLAKHDHYTTRVEVVPPDPKLPHAANFLSMLRGEEPSVEDADALDTTMILYADHTMNASTFTGLITASTLADPYTVVASAIGSLKGPLHGGANEAVVAAFLSAEDQNFLTHRGVDPRGTDPWYRDDRGRRGPHHRRAR